MSLENLPKKENEEVFAVESGPRFNKYFLKEGLAKTKDHASKIVEAYLANKE